MDRWSSAFVIALACVLILVGCSSPSAENDTTAPTEPRPTTAPSTAADTPALVVTESATIATDPDSRDASPDSSVTLIKNVTLVEGRDADGDRGSGTSALRIRADTSVPTADGTGDPGDPYFTIAINGVQQFTTAEVERTTNGTFTIPVDASQLPAGQGQLRIRIQLLDEDIAFDDEIATRTVRVEYPPANPPIRPLRPPFEPSRLMTDQYEDFGAGTGV
jgi:hypothetical protein